MDIVLALILLIVSLIVLDQFSHLTITNSTKVSDVTGLSKATLGFIVLAFSTSLPELSVAFIAALSVDPVTGESQATVSIGNVLGSNIANICLIIGLATLLIALRRSATNTIPKIAKEELGSLYFGLFLASVIPLSLVYIAEASWFVGLILILIFVAYTYRLSKIRIPTEGGASVTEEMKRELKRYIAFTLLGIFGVIVSAYFIVESAVVIARSAGIPKTFIGATIVAVGTSLPELSLTVRAFLKGHTALGLGNIVGSGFINITLILGISLLVPTLAGISFKMNMFVFQDIVIFSLIANLFLWYFLSMGRLTWKEGAIFLFIYLLFLATSMGAIHLRVQPT